MVVARQIPTDGLQNTGPGASRRSAGIFEKAMSEQLINRAMTTRWIHLCGFASCLIFYVFLISIPLKAYTISDKIRGSIQESEGDTQKQLTSQTRKSKSSTRSS